MVHQPEKSELFRALGYMNSVCCILCVIRCKQALHRVKSCCIWSFSGPYFLTLGQNIQSKCRKIRTRKLYNTNTVNAALLLMMISALKSLLLCFYSFYSCFLLFVLLLIVTLISFSNVKTHAAASLIYCDYNRVLT